MRLRGWWFVVLGVVAATFLLGRHLELPVAIGGEALPADLGSAHRSLVYRIPEGGELVFDLPPGASRLRLLTNAELGNRGVGEEPVEGWRYGLEIRVDGWQPSESDTRRYHFRSRLPRAGRSENGEPLPQSRYLRSGVRPLDGRLVPLRLDTLDFRPARLRIGLASRDDALSGVSVRVYFRDEIHQLKRHAMWPRLSLQERERRAEGNVYPHDLLSEQEKQALVRFIWSPLSPSGVEGRDFQRRVLLQSDHRTPSLAAATRRPIGLALRPGVRGVIRVPEPTRVRLEALALDDERTLGVGELELRFVDGSGRARTGPRTVAGSDARKPLFDLSAGWLEVTVPVRAVVGVSMGVEAEEDTTWLEPESILGYACGDESTLEYRILTVDGAPTPFRIDLRSEGLARAGTVDYRISNERGEPIANGRLRHDEPLSHYDWADGSESSERVSEPSRHYFSLPAGAASLRLTACTAPLIVTAYNHPAGQVWRIPVPASPGREPSRRWFRLRPLDASERRARGETRMLRLQERPAEPDDTPRQESLSAEGFDLGGGSVGRYVLVPTRSEDASGILAGFTELAEGLEARVQLVAASGRDSVAPTLLFRRDEAGPFRLRVEIDGRVVVDEEAVGRQGELLLPRVAEGGHRVLPRGDGNTRFLLSHVRAAGSPVYSRRFVTRLPESRFELSVERPRSVVVTGRLYFASGGIPGCSLGVEIAGPAPAALRELGAWTFRRRVYEIGPRMDSRVAVLGGDRLWMERSHPFYIALGDDLPPGSYRLRVTPRCPEETFVTLSRLVPHTIEERRYYLESDVETMVGRAGRPADLGG